MFRLCSVLILAFATLAQAQIAVRTPAAPILCQVECTAPGVIAWTVSPMPAVRREIPNGIAIVAEPGVYLVQAETEDGAGYYRRVTLAAPVPGPVPPPQPPPPDPPPQPPPVQPQKLTVVVIEESSQRTPAQANILLSPVVAAYVAAGQHRWYVFDKDSATAGSVTQCGPRGCKTVPVAGLDPAFQPFFDAAKGKTLPRLVIAVQGVGGKVLADVALPGTAAEVLDALKKYGG